MEEENKKLREALAAIVAYADQTWVYWDQPGYDHKVGKRLAAMSGDLKGYDAAIDSVHAILEGVK